MAAFLLWAAVYATRRLGGADYWWHTAFGRYLWEMRTFPRVDQFTFAHHGGPWVNISWLIDFLFYGIHSLGGFTALAATKTVLIAGTVCLMARGTHRPGRSVLFILPVALALGVHWGRFVLRPFLVTSLLTALTMLLLERDRARQAAQPRVVSRAASRELWWLVPIMWLWASTHGAFVMVWALLGAYGMERLVQARPPAGAASEERTAWQRHFRGLVILGIATLIISLLQPYGTMVFYRIRVLFGYEALIAGTGEWQPILKHAAGSPRLFWLWSGFLTVLAFSFIVNVRRFSLFRFFAAAGPCYLTFTANRHMDVFLYTAVPVIVLNLHGAWDAAAGRPALRGLIALCRRPAVTLAWTVAVIGATGYHAAQYLSTRILVNQHVEWYRWWAVLPYTFAETPTAHLNRYPTGGRIFNEFEQGGYILWHRFPEPVYIDSKGLDEVQMLDYWDALTSPAAFAQAVAKYDIRAVVMALGSRSADMYRGLARDPAWTLEVFDATGYLFTRRDGPPKVHSRPTGDPTEDLPAFTTAPAPPFDPRAVRFAPVPMAHQSLGTFWTAADMPRRAAAAYEAGVRASPHSAPARLAYADALLQLAQPAQASAAVLGLENVRDRSVRARVALIQARIALAQGDTAGALASAQRAGAAAGDPGFQLRTQLLLQLGDVDGAVAEGERWVRRYSRSLAAHNDLAIALQARGDTTAALKYVERGLGLDRHAAQLYYTRGLILQSAGREDEARAAFRRARALGFTPVADAG